MPDTKKSSQEKDKFNDDKNDKCKNDKGKKKDNCKCKDKDCCCKNKCEQKKKHDEPKPKPPAKKEVKPRAATPKPATPKPATPKPPAPPPSPKPATPKPVLPTPTPHAPLPAPKPKPPLIGTMTYTLTPEAQNSPLRSEIVDGMDAAVDTYNRYAKFDTRITVHYDANVPTAEASGHTITFGSMVGYRVSLHEIAHVLGVGTRGGWWSSKVHAWEEMVWVGRRGLAKIQEFDGPDAVLHADGLHFWNYGLNWQEDLVEDADWRHVEVVDAMVSDMIEAEELERGNV